MSAWCRSGQRFLEPCLGFALPLHRPHVSSKTFGLDGLERCSFLFVPFMDIFIPLKHTAVMNHPGNSFYQAPSLPPPTNHPELGHFLEWPPSPYGFWWIITLFPHWRLHLFKTTARCTLTDVCLWPDQYFNECLLPLRPANQTTGVPEIRSTAQLHSYKDATGISQGVVWRAWKEWCNLSV